MKRAQRGFVPLAFGFVAVGSAYGQTTSLASIATGGAQGDSSSAAATISADGRFVAFHGTATNLVPGDTNGVGDVFVRDLATGTTERVSVATGGAEADASSVFVQPAALSADGRFAAYASRATNLVGGDTNGQTDVFVRDRQSGTTERVSVATSGVQGGGASYGAVISRDGRYVAFVSAASFAAADTNTREDVYVRDRLNGTTELASPASNGGAADGDSFELAISDDGRFVTFASRATNLVVGDTNARTDVFLRDRVNGTTERVSVGAQAQQGDGDSRAPSITADGRWVLFTSRASNFTASGTLESVVYLRDRQNGTLERVDFGSGGTVVAGSTWPGNVSADGRFVTFSSIDAGYVPGDTNGWNDSFLRDRLNGTTERVSLTVDGTQVARGGHAPRVSDDGRFVTFEGDSSELVAGDTNGLLDVFVRDRGANPPLAACLGDGSATACPCGPGATGAGCPNSTNALGAVLVSTGTASLAADTVVLTGSRMPNSSAIFVQGSSVGAGVVFGDGLRCVGGSILRLRTRENVGGVAQYPSAGDEPLSVRGAVSGPGVRSYQVWYRNPAAFRTSAVFNLTNAVELTWIP